MLSQAEKKRLRLEAKMAAEGKTLVTKKPVAKDNDGDDMDGLLQFKGKYEGDGEDGSFSSEILPPKRVKKQKLYTNKGKITKFDEEGDEIEAFRLMSAKESGSDKTNYVPSTNTVSSYQDKVAARLAAAADDDKAVERERLKAKRLKRRNKNKGGDEDEDDEEGPMVATLAGAVSESEADSDDSSDESDDSTDIKDTEAMALAMLQKRNM